MRHATLAMLVAATFAAGCSQMSDMMHADNKSASEQVTLTGSNEVPPVTSPASGSGTVSVSSDHMVTARITVTGMTATAAHIHQGAPGSSGPVIVPFVKEGENTFVAAPGAKMTDEQYRKYKDGETYVNVHSAKNPAGEVRGQLKGK
jgi:hypothetical protein